MKNRSKYGYKTGYPGNLSARECCSVISLVKVEALSKRCVAKRFEVSIGVITMILAMHENGIQFEKKDA